MRRDDWLLGQLPMGMLDDDFFTRFVRIFQDVATTFLEDADNLDNIVDVRVAPESLVPWLGSWIAVPAMDPNQPPDVQRKLVREYAKILAWRGTGRGLAQLLGLLPGAAAEITESGGVDTIRVARTAEHRDTYTEDDLPPDPTTLQVRVTSTEVGEGDERDRVVGWLSIDDFVRLVADEVPADVALTVVVDNEQVWPRPRPAVRALEAAS